MRVAPQIRSGSVQVNGSTIHSEPAFGLAGLGGSSGFGRFNVESVSPLRRRWRSSWTYIRPPEVYRFEGGGVPRARCAVPDDVGGRDALEKRFGLRLRSDVRGVGRLRRENSRSAREGLPIQTTASSDTDETEGQPASAHNGNYSPGTHKLGPHWRARCPNFPTPARAPPHPPLALQPCPALFSPTSPP